MDKNIGNQIVDYDMKLQESRKTIARLEKITSEIQKKKDEIEGRLNDLLFTYNINDLVDLMDISDTMKILLRVKIDDVHIYKVKNGLDETLNIKYKFDNSEYTFTINKKYTLFQPIVHVYKDRKEFKTFDLKREFVILDFGKLKIERLFENYIDLIIKKNKCLRLGMFLLGYYYLIEYLQYKNSDINTLLKMNSIEMRKIKKILSCDLTSYIFENHYQNGIKERVDIKKTIDKFMNDLSVRDDSLLNKNKK